MPAAIPGAPEASTRDHAAQAYARGQFNREVIHNCRMLFPVTWRSDQNRSTVAGEGHGHGNRRMLSDAWKIQLHLTCAGELRSMAGKIRDANGKAALAKIAEDHEQLAKSLEETSTDDLQGQTA